MFQKILVPLDGSLLAKQVYPHVAEIARAFYSQIDLVGVCEPEETESGQTCGLYLNHEVNQLQNILGTMSIKIRQTVLEGNPAEQIQKYARQNDIDIIILSSYGRSGLKPWSLGSTVNKLLYNADVPIIVVRAQGGRPATSETNVFRRILVPLDGSDASAVVIPIILELTRKLPPEITLMQVVEKGHHVHTIGGLDYVQYNDQDIDNKKAGAQQYIDEVATSIKRNGVTVNTIVRLGEPADEILKTAGEEDVSLIILANHGHSAIENWFYGSVSHKIVQATRHSFMLVPSDRKTE
jgi:nucleotide-binding universal stress UspA family protein